MSSVRRDVLRVPSVRASRACVRVVEGEVVEDDVSVVGESDTLAGHKSGIEVIEAVRKYLLVAVTYFMGTLRRHERGRK